MLNKQCAPSNAPVRILSRTLAHEDSFVTSTFSPYFAKSPSSFAITIGAQSVSEMKPRWITSLLATFTFSGAIDESIINRRGAMRNKIDLLYIFFMVNLFLAGCYFATNSEGFIDSIRYAHVDTSAGLLTFFTLAEVSVEVENIVE